MEMTYQDNYKYRLYEDFSIQIENPALWPSVPIKHYYITFTKEGKLTLHRGYAWDGVSGFPDFKCLMIGAAVHDALYELIRWEYLSQDLRINADREMRQIFIQQNTPKPIATILTSVVKRVGHQFSSPDHKRQLYSIQYK